MGKPVRPLCLALIIVMLSISVSAQKDKVKYVPRYYDPVLEELEELQEKRQDVRDSVTAEIRKRQKKQKEEEKKGKQRLRFDFVDVVKPASPAVFETTFHFPPVAQYRTGTCWCFSGTSFLESEVARLTGRRIKLSEMYVIYHEYLAKVRHFVKERGDFWVSEGSAGNAVIHIIGEHGIVPSDVYPGYSGEEKYDHTEMAHQIRDYLSHVKEHGYWYEEEVIRAVRLILNKHMGKPPESFAFEGREMTPLEFLGDVLKVKPDNYVDVMSTLSMSFYTTGKLDVYDNWRNDSNYYNVPLDEWYDAMKSAIAGGYTLAVGLDVTEPGYNGFEDAAIIPDFDIPHDFINQDAREFRLNNGTTSDDHGVHVVGHAEVGDHDWYLIKDSARSGRHGKFEGYFFFRDDYMRLKIIAFLVHRDALGSLLERFDKGDSSGSG
jgi:bleomycin hydrolase